MIELEKNKLMEEWLDATYSTFAHTLNTADYVPPKFNEKILKVIYKHSKKSFKGVNRAYKALVAEEKKAHRDARLSNVKKCISAKWAKVKCLLKRKQRQAQPAIDSNIPTGDSDGSPS